MMLCDMLLSAGLIAAASCGQPDDGAAKAAAAQEPPVLAGAQLEENAVPSGRKTGMTLVQDATAVDQNDICHAVLASRLGEGHAHDRQLAEGEE